MDRQALRAHWQKRASELLLGRRIVAVAYLDQHSCRAMMWDRSCIVLTLDDGTHVFPSADDEGNGPGALFTDAPSLPAVPVI